jgi:RNA polymerase sigma factor (sigma-70 family)
MDSPLPLHPVPLWDAVLLAVETPYTELLASERRDLVVQLMSGMSPQWHTILLLKYRDGRSISEIADHLRVSRSAVHQMHERILKSMRKDLRTRKIDSSF